MSFQDVRGFYEERDDEPAPEPVALAEFRCWWCSNRFAQPEDMPDRFCSRECELRWCEWSAKQLRDGVTQPGGGEPP